MSRHRQVAIMVGKEPPAQSISWEDGYFVVIFSELDPDDPDDSTPSMPVCLDCLLDDADEQLGRGLDLAKRHGQVDFDVATGEWFIPRG